MNRLRSPEESWEALILSRNSLSSAEISLRRLLTKSAAPLTTGAMSLTNSMRPAPARAVEDSAMDSPMPYLSSRLTSGMTRRSERSGSRLNLVASAVASSLPVRSSSRLLGLASLGVREGGLSPARLRSRSVALAIGGVSVVDGWFRIRTSSKSDMCHYVRAFLLEPHPFRRGYGSDKRESRPETDPGVRRDP